MSNHLHDEPHDFARRPALAAPAAFITGTILSSLEDFDRIPGIGDGCPDCGCLEWDVHLLGRQKTFARED
jgi:hypothetical protein